LHQINQHHVRSVMKLILRLLESTFFAADDSTATSDYVEYIEQTGHIRAVTIPNVIRHKWFYQFDWTDRISEIWIIPVFFQHMVMVSRQ